MACSKNSLVGSLLLPVFVAVLLMTACTSPKAAVTAQASGREITLSDTTLPPDTIHLGRVMQGEVIRYDMQLRNATAKPVVILSVQSSCGCTQVEYDRRPIATGARVPFSFEYHSSGFSGWQRKKITLRHTASSEPCTVVVTADVVTE